MRIAFPTHGLCMCVLLLMLAPDGHTTCHAAPPPAPVSEAQTALTAPTDLLPKAGHVTCIPTPGFSWQAIAGATRYEVEFSTTADFAQVTLAGESPLPRYVHAGEIHAGQHFWRVRAVAADGSAGPHSAVQKLGIVPPTREIDIPNGADALTVSAAIKEAARQTPAQVNFARGGTYRLSPEAGELIHLKGVADLVINGNGANITFTRASTALAELHECRNILIRDLTVDFDPVPYTVGTILSTRVEPAGEGTGKERAFFSVKLEPGMPAFDAPPISTHWTWGVVLDGQVPGRIARGTHIVISTHQKSLTGAGDTFTLELTNPGHVRNFTPGNKYIQFARSKGGRELISMRGCEDVTALGVTNYSVSAGHYISIESTGTKVLNCKSLIKEGRWFGGNADGVHARANVIGPWVEGCHFQGVGDDAVALYNKGVAILAQESATALRLDAQFYNLAAGDEFQIFNPREGVLVAERLRVTKVEARPAGDAGAPGKHFRVEFEPPVDGEVTPGSTEPKAAVQGDQVFTLTRVNAQFMLRNNTFENIRRYGAVIRGGSGAIVGNRFVGVSDCAIILRNEPGLWRNGLQSQDVLIQGNTIVDSGLAKDGAGRGQIEVVLHKLGGKLSPWRGHQRIRILENVIQNWDQHGIQVTNAQDVEIRGNVIESSRAEFSTPDQEHYGIRVDNVGGEVVVRDNEIRDPRKLTAPVSVTDSR